MCMKRMKVKKRLDNKKKHQSNNDKVKRNNNNTGENGKDNENNNEHDEGRTGVDRLVYWLPCSLALLVYLNTLQAGLVYDDQ